MKLLAFALLIGSVVDLLTNRSFLMHALLASAVTFTPVLGDYIWISGGTLGLILIIVIVVVLLRR